jgi:hypothetical protein
LDANGNWQLATAAESNFVGSPQASPYVAVCSSGCAGAPTFTSAQLYPFSAQTVLGRWCSIQVGTSGLPRIAYDGYGGAPPADHLLYAECTAPPCGAGAWSVADLGTSGGKYASLAVDATPRTMIATADASGGVDLFACGSSACGGQPFTVTRFDAGPGMGSFTSLASSPGFFAIAYRDATNNRLKLAQGSSVGLSPSILSFEATGVQASLALGPSGATPSVFITHVSATNAVDLVSAP